MKTSEAKSCIFMVKNGNLHENRNLGAKQGFMAVKGISVISYGTVLGSS